MISPSVCCLSFDDLADYLALQDGRVVPFGLSMVEDTTYFGRLFNLSTQSPLCDDACAAEVLVAPATQQQRLGALCLAELVPQPTPPTPHG